MTRASKLALMVCPLCGVLVACGSDEQSGTPAGDSGAAGEAQGSGGDTGAGTGGRGSGAGGTAGRTSAGDSGGAGGATLGQAGQGTGGRAGGTAGAAGSKDSVETSGGGATAGHAGQSMGGQGDAAGGPAGGTDTAEAGGGGVTLGQAGQGTAGGGPTEGLPGAGSFTKLTVRSSGGMPMMQDPADECGVSYKNVWSVDRGSRTLDWDFCAWSSSPAVVRRGSRTLADSEFQALLNALSLVAPSTRYMCGADKEGVSLELEVDGSSTLYADDFYRCEDDPNDQNYVQGLDPLAGWVHWLSMGGAIPATPDTLFVSTGDTLDPDPPSGSACWTHYDPHYELDVSTGELSWDYCTTPAESGAYTVVTGSRVLDAAELESVLSAYGNLEPGASGPCDSLNVPTSSYVASVRIGSQVHLTDEGASCSVDATGAYAIGVAALADLVDDLVR